MAITKTTQIKSDRHLQTSLEYIMKPEKTENGKWIHAFETVPAFASTDFLLTKNLGELARNNHRIYQNDVYAHHIVQAFDKNDEVTPEEVYKIGIETAMQFTAGKHEFVVCTHVDRDHLHNHIIFNATSYFNLRKYEWKKKTARELRDISDLIILKNGLKIIEQDRWRSYTGFKNFRKQSMHRTQLKMRIDFLKSICTTQEEFKERLKSLNVKTKRKEINYYDSNLAKYRTIYLDSYCLEHPYFEGEEYLDSYYLATGKHLPKKETTTKLDLNVKNKYELTKIHEIIEGNQKAVELIQSFDEDSLEKNGIHLRQKQNGDIEYYMENRIIHENLLKSENERENWLDIWERRERIIQEPVESLVTIPKKWVSQDYSEGLFVPVKFGARTGLIKFDANLVDETPENYIVSIGAFYDFTIYANDQVDRTIKGEDLIRQYEIEQDILPKEYLVKEEYIKFVSLKGISIAIPEYGIEKMFISSKDVKIDKLTGQTKIILGDNWNYRYKQVGYDELKKAGKKVYQESIKGFELGTIVQGNVPEYKRENEIGKTYSWRTRNARLKQVVGNLNQLTAMEVTNYAELQLKLEEMKEVVEYSKNELLRLKNEIGEFHQVQKYLKLIADNREIFELLEQNPNIRNEIEFENQNLLSELNYAKEYLAKQNINEYMTTDQIEIAVKETQKYAKELEAALVEQNEQYAFLERMQERFIQNESKQDKDRNDKLER